MKEFVRTMPEAWALYDALLADPRIGLATEPRDIDKELRRLTQLPRGSTHLWNDAYLAAFAIAADMRMLTFDRAFAQFNLPDCTILT